MRVSIYWYIVGLISSCTLLAIAYFYFQNTLLLTPCPLCVFQRVALVLVALFCLSAIIHRPTVMGHRLYSLLIFISLLLGVGIAGRQVWLQHLPADQVPACGIDPIYQWLQTQGEVGFFQMVLTTLQGSGDCAEVNWTFLGLSIGGWMLAIFSIMAVIAIALMSKPPISHTHR